MDADCLIKLAKSSLKEFVCRNFSVAIPTIVEKEIVVDLKKHPDAVLIKQNIETDLLAVTESKGSAERGEDAIFEVFQAGQYDAICSDDKKFIKRLRIFNIPYLTPAVLIIVLLKNKTIHVETALHHLESLLPMISEEEYSTVKVIIENRRWE